MWNVDDAVDIKPPVLSMSVEVENHDVNGVNG